MTFNCPIKHFDILFRTATSGFTSGFISGSLTWQVFLIRIREKREVVWQYHMVGLLVVTCPQSVDGQGPVVGAR